MKTYTAPALAEVIEKHGKWLRREDGGERADLSGANLSGAKNQIYIGQRSGGYQFFARHDKEKSAWIISAGCRYFTPNEYRTHAQKYNCGTKRAETLALIDFAEIQIKIRGVVEVGNE
jgi:hypothetical protein